MVCLSTRENVLFLLLCLFVIRCYSLCVVLVIALCHCRLHVDFVFVVCVLVRIVILVIMLTVKDGTTVLFVRKDMHVPRKPLLLINVLKERILL